MESDQTGHQYGQVELAGERFQGGQRSCRWRNGNDVSVPQGGQCNEAVIHHLSPSACPLAPGSPPSYITDSRQPQAGGKH